MKLIKGSKSMINKFEFHALFLTVNVSRLHSSIHNMSLCSSLNLQCEHGPFSIKFRNTFFIIQFNILCFKKQFSIFKKIVQAKNAFLKIFRRIYFKIIVQPKRFPQNVRVINKFPYQSLQLYGKFI